MDLLTAINANRHLVRVALRTLRKSEERDDLDILDDALSFFDRDGDYEIVRRALKNRYAVGVKRESADEDTSLIDDTSLTSGGYETYVRNSVATQIDSGITETINTGCGTKIAKALATLYSNRHQTWKIDDDSADEIFTLIRKRGKLGLSLALADYYSIALGSCAVHVYWAGRSLRYDVVVPQCVFAVYGDTVVDDGIERSPNSTDLDDASAVIVKTASSSLAASSENYDLSSWIAYCGASSDYPDGRMVSYRAREYWPIPEFGSPNSVDYLRAGVPCNPLTYSRNHGGPAIESAVTTEYPLVIVDGGIRGRSGTCLPTSTSLYNSAVEIEVAWSAILGHAIRASRGKDVFSLEAGAHTALPRSLEIPVLKPGQTYQRIAGDNAPNVASDVLKLVSRNLAEGFSVPGYYVVQDAAVTPESGIAIALRTQPLIDNRRWRIALNESLPQTLFGIERGLLAEYLGSESGIPWTAAQSWSPGEYTLPSDEQTRIATIVTEREKYLIDHVEAVRQANNLATAEDAQALIDTFTERDPDYNTKTPEPNANPFGAFK